jgi:hypothetical protein
MIQKGEFEYDDLIPGMYYFNPEQKVFVQSVPHQKVKKAVYIK